MPRSASAACPDRPIRVMQLIAGCQVGGLEMVALRLVSRLRREFEFRVVCYDAEGPLKSRYEEIGVDVVFEQRRMGIDLRYPFRLARHIRSGGIDVLHAHNNTALFYGVLAAVLCGGRRVVFTAHDRALPRLPARVLQRLLALLTTRAVAVSEAGRRNLLDFDGFFPERVTVVHNGADESQFANLPERLAARRALDVPEDAEVAGTVARMHPEKNLPLLVRAFARVAASRPRAMLLLAGDGPVRPECVRIAEDTGVRERVRFLGTRSDVARILAALDVFVLSSDTEGLPVAVVEAMAAERPVVATDVGAVAELVHENDNGHLVPAGDETALAAAIERVLADPETARRMGERGREIFRDGFTLERMAMAYGRVYREAVEGVR